MPIGKPPTSLYSPEDISFFGLYCNPFLQSQGGSWLEVSEGNEKERFEWRSVVFYLPTQVTEVNPKHQIPNSSVRVARLYLQKRAFSGRTGFACQPRWQELRASSLGFTNWDLKADRRS